MTNQNPEQELTIKFQMMERQIMGIRQQLQAVEQALFDISALHVGLDEIKKDKIVLASLGKGIFVKAKIISEDLTVDIGNKNYVKKTLKDTKELIEEQIAKLEEVKGDLNHELDHINKDLTETMLNHQKSIK